MDILTTKPNDIKYYSSVKERSVSWLWYPYIPYGKVTLLQGDPGDGKSTFMIHIAAILTTGGKLPGSLIPSDLQNVIYQCSEDNPSDTVKPRLIAAGADCNRVAFIDETERQLTIDDTRIENALADTSARLLIIDPIQAYIPADADMLNAVKMRSLLRRLVMLADKYQCAIVLIGHMNKAGGKNLYRNLGSIDIAAIARSVLMIARDKDNPEIRYLFPVKSNLAYEGKAVRFQMDKKEGFKILDLCDITLQQDQPKIKKETITKAKKAENIIYSVLSEGEKPSSHVLDTLSGAGISERTARSVCKNIGVKSFRKNGIWYWKLQGGHDA